jgi:hypothetical protein
MSAARDAKLWLFVLLFMLGITGALTCFAVGAWTIGAWILEAIA